MKVKVTISFIYKDLLLIYSTCKNLFDEHFNQFVYIFLKP